MGALLIVLGLAGLSAAWWTLSVAARSAHRDKTSSGRLGGHHRRHGGPYPLAGSRVVGMNCVVGPPPDGF